MPIYKGRIVDMKDIFPVQPTTEGMKKEYPLDIISSGVNVGKSLLGRMPCNTIENVLPICPECHDTKTVKIDSTIKCSSPPIYTLTCEKCMVQWESNLEWRD